MTWCSPNEKVVAARLGGRRAGRSVFSADALSANAEETNESGAPLGET